MTDRHLRILRLVAKKRQQELDDHDAADQTQETAPAGRRRHLKQLAARTRGRVAEAEARRVRPDRIS